MDLRKKDEIVRAKNEGKELTKEEKQRLRKEKKQKGKEDEKRHELNPVLKRLPERVPSGRPCCGEKDWPRNWSDNSDPTPPSCGWVCSTPRVSWQDPTLAL
ncbi:hypothetical protein J4Q44_G00340890 [Coregonus suidteri]|uniref:Uncharacterized protein n=1 Tax=Coregonus suidteri TaxID=861788 RepID=A0AAN8KNE9_9TELE